MHYFRWRRTGDPLGLRSLGERDRKPDGNYVKVRLPPGHPLGDPRLHLWVHEHRVVYFAANPGPHACHWCRMPLEPGALHIDHLDHDGTNNRLDNLRASCRRCNAGRRRGADLTAWAYRVAVHRLVNAHAAELEREAAIVLDELPDPVVAVTEAKRTKALSRGLDSRRAA